MGDQRYMPLINMLDNISIESKVDAYNKAQMWPGFPIHPGNPYPIEVPRINEYVREVKPIPSPGGRVLRKNQRYVFLSNYSIYP